MSEHNKHIKALIAGLMTNNEAKVDQLTNELVESMIAVKKDLITETIRKTFQGELKCPR